MLLALAARLSRDRDLDGVTTASPLDTGVCFTRRPLVALPRRRDGVSCSSGCAVLTDDSTLAFESLLRRRRWLAPRLEEDSMSRRLCRIRDDGGSVAAGDEGGKADDSTMAA